METALLWALVLLAFGLWAFGLMSSYNLFGLVQLLLAVAAVVFLTGVVRRRRSRRGQS
jgi:membrane protein DedA with SNARE-associated domain